MLSTRLGIAIAFGVGLSFAFNHLGARIAFDHGASVPAAVSIRASVLALVVLAMMKLQGVRLAIPEGLRGWALLAGVLIAAQSYCLYTAVALIPPALALLVFQTSAILYVLISWATGKEAPRWRALLPMVLALAGLALALGLRLEQIEGRWLEVGTGVLWALASSACMSAVYYLNAHVLKAMDGRLRTFTMVVVTATLLIAGGAAAHALRLPVDATGWAGIALLTVFYCIAMGTFFFFLPRMPSVSTVALNSEPISLLFLGWIFLGHGLTALQLVGAFVTVGAIAWLGFLKK